MAQGHSNNPDRHMAKPVRLVSCKPKKTVGAAESERIAELVFQNGSTEMPPLAVRLPDLRSLVSAAIYVLICYGDEYGHALARAVRGDATDTETETPIAPLAVPSATPPAPKQKPKSAKRSTVIPSIRPNGSLAPISDRDVWLIHRMLQNVKSHDDFMGLVGVDLAAPDDSADVASPKCRRTKNLRVGRKNPRTKPKHK